jgi:prepilin-type N-terminal cleavage/methylation domain-containing protein/prepilin-type processing-associated H-X9-DG protein
MLSVNKAGDMDYLARRGGLNLNGLTLGVKARWRAFTLIELLVVIAIIAILAAVLLPVLHQAQVRGQTVACIDHQKQLATAWVMYAQDNNDYCVGNNWGTEEHWPEAYRGIFSPTAPITQPTNWISGWMDPSGSSPGDTGGPGGTGESDNTNDDLLIDPSYASLGDYIKNRLLFICPSCAVKVDSYSGGPKNVSEIRSVSMNAWVGYTCNPPSSTTVYRTFNRVPSIAQGIGPVDLFIFMEERGESIDDGSFATIEGTPQIFNWPTDYHNLAATVSFADGHVDVHRWVGEAASGVANCTAPQMPIVQSKWTSEQVSAKSADLIWLQQHATVPYPQYQ